MQLPTYPLQFWLAAVATALLIGISKAGFGGGPGVIATPLLSLVLPVPEAAALLLPILLLADLFAVRHYTNQVDKPSLRALLPGALLGILLGAFFFRQFSDQEQVLKLGMGILALAFVLYQAVRSRILQVVGGKRPSPLTGFILGTTSGFTSTLAHVGGPPMMIYMLPQKLPRNLFVGTTAVFFFIINLVKLVPYALLGLLVVGNLSVTLLLLPVLFVGTRLGVWLNQRFSELWFNRVVYAILLLVGLQLILGQSFISLIFG
ncbi:MAG: sulfite exporter TauE/SafE family protein [Candidatus Promineifilaceae bacterium]|nr:sulfite exporter TauE/SafE family protein [Anaerolineaceae bacterium]